MPPASGRAGQATVEAAFAIPVVFLLLLLLLQPGILLYDRIVMNAAAAEACRMLATGSPGSVADGSFEEAVRRRLGAIPQQENFHCHEAGCSWAIGFSGDEGSSEARVSIGGRVKLLPLLDAGAALLGIADDEGTIGLSVQVATPTQDAWVAGSEFGLDPGAWVGKWR